MNLQSHSLCHSDILDVQHNATVKQRSFPERALQIVAVLWEPIKDSVTVLVCLPYRRTSLHSSFLSLPVALLQRIFNPLQQRSVLHFLTAIAQQEG